MELRYTLTADDLHAFSRYWSAQRATRLKKRYTVLPMAVLIAAGITMLVFPGGWLNITFGEALVAVMPPLAIFAAICVIGSFLHRKAVAQIYSRESTLSLRDDGVHFGDGDTQSQTRWEALRRIVETPEHFFLIYGYQHAVIVPRRALDAGQHGQLRETLSEHRPDLFAAMPAG